MYCVCGHLNPAGNNFCGMCGRTLTPSPGPRASATATAAEQEAPLSAEHQAQPDNSTEVPISGPSFLGLDSQPQRPPYEYLLEEQQPSHTGIYAFLLVVAVVASVVAWQWQPISAFVQQRATQPQVTQSKANTSTPPADAPGTPPTGTNGVAAAEANSGMPPTDANTADGGETASAANPKSGEKQPGEEKNQAKGSVETKQATAAAPDAGSGKDATEAASPAAAKPAERLVERPSARSSAPPAPPAGQALVLTGEKYLYGRDASPNCGQALVYFKAAAEQHNPAAMSHLGAMYATGECVSQDRTVAYDWFRRALAADRSNPYFEKNLTMLWRDMSEVERQTVLRAQR